MVHLFFCLVEILYLKVIYFEVVSHLSNICDICEINCNDRILPISIIEIKVTPAVALECAIAQWFLKA